MFTWRAVNNGGTVETLPLPNTVINKGQSSVLVFKPIAYGEISVQLTCTVDFPVSGNIITGEQSSIIILLGEPLNLIIYGYS